MISFDLTDEQLLLEQSVREWAAREVAPKIHDLDREHRFDRAMFSGMASLGLLGMQERAQLLGGEVSILGAPGRGTTVSVSIPMPRPQG